MAEFTEGGVVDVPLAQTGEGIAECELLKWFVQEVCDYDGFPLTICSNFLLVDPYNDSKWLKFVENWEWMVFSLLVCCLSVLLM